MIARPTPSLRSLAGRPLAQAIARSLLATIAGLALWATAPTALGWHCTVVLSGSMQPVLRVGDLVDAAPVDPATLTPGRVVLVHNPARPGHLLMHRILRIEGDKIITKGDGNLTPDSTPVDRSQVMGIAVLRVPYLGMISVWAHQRRYLPLAAVMVVITLLGLVATGPGGPGSGSDLRNRLRSKVRSRSRSIRAVSLAGLLGARPPGDRVA